MKTIDENLIRFSGKFPIDRKLEIDGDFTFLVKGGVIKKEVGSNQDGTVNLTWIVKLTDIKIAD